ncbi:MAG TPA: hypothetical protein VHE55_08545 [Fimbriimonadaceae bacterium]|nr:hypothetical protein [Fimbriimonadaceae bacterium]
MPLKRWILAVEPEEHFREIVWEETAYCRASGIEVVFVSQAPEMLREITGHGTLPEILIVEWLAAGPQMRTAFEDLKKCGLLARLYAVAVTGDNPRRALCEAQALGVARFICKRPDEIAYRNKIGEAIREKIPTAMPTPASIFA